jgi:hypothetical protein
MKVWARYAVAVMVLVDEHQDSIERVVMVPGERLIDRETMGDIPWGGSWSCEVDRLPRLPSGRFAGWSDGAAAAGR